VSSIYLLQKYETRQMREMHIEAGFKLKIGFLSRLDFYDFQTQIGCNGFQNAIAHKHARTEICAASGLDRAATGQLDGDHTGANLRHGADL
jgi:hypothetical protein